MIGRDDGRRTGGYRKSALLRRQVRALALTWLLALVAGAPAIAQEGTEGYSNDETRRLYEEFRQTRAEYDQAVAEDEACSESIECGYERDQELLRRKSALYGEVERLAEDVSYARLEAIQEAPVEGSAQQQFEAEERKYDALQALEGWTVENTDIASDAPDEVADELAATEDRVEELQAAAEEQAAGDPPAEQDAAGAAGGVGLAGDDGGTFYLLPALALVGVLLYFSASIARNLAKTLRGAGGKKRGPATPLAPRPSPSAASERTAPRPPDPPPTSAPPSSASPSSAPPSEPRREPVVDRTAGRDEGEARPSYQESEARRRSDVPPPDDDGRDECPSCGSEVGAGANFCRQCGHTFGDGG